MIQWFPGHMAKTRRLLTEISKVLDIVVVLLDARCPYSSFSPVIDEIFQHKLKLMVFTKTDLADDNQTQLWKKYYESIGYHTIALDLLSDNVTKEITHHAEILLADKIKKEAEKGMKRRRMKMVITGVPNVGKSTLINKYTKKKVVVVGNKAGVTKQLQWIRVSDKFELLDSPGVLWPKFDIEHIGFALASTKAIKNEILPVDDVAVFILNYLIKYYPEQLEKHYSITSVDDILECYEVIGRKFGIIMSGNRVDYDRVSERILSDAQQGKFGKVTWDNYEYLRDQI